MSEMRGILSVWSGSCCLRSVAVEGLTETVRERTVGRTDTRSDIRAARAYCTGRRTHLRIAPPTPTHTHARTHARTDVDRENKYGYEKDS